MWADLIEGETRDGFGFILKDRVNDLGYQSITAPGSLKAYAEAHGAHGVLPWKTVVQPAIDYATNGWAVRPHVYFWWSIREQFGRVPNPERLAFSASGRDLYCQSDGRPKEVGAWITNPDLARTLTRIAHDGAETFYTGEIAEEIARDMAANGALLSAADLRDYRTRHCLSLIHI